MWASTPISVSASEELEHLGGVTKGDGGGSSDGFNGVNVASQTSGVSLVSVALDSGTANGGASAHDTSVNTARDAVLLLDVDLGQVEVLGVVSRVLLDISPGGGIDQLSHLESLDGLILGHNTGAVDASNDVSVSLVLLSSSVVSSL